MKQDWIELIKASGGQVVRYKYELSYYKNTENLIC